MFLPSTYWHDPQQAASQTVRRLNTPLHYHLRRHDYIAFQKELGSGTNPFIQDECGRTSLDLALLMLEDLAITSLCTSFPVDFLIKTLEYDSRYPAKFVPNYNSVYQTLYDHPNALRLASSKAGLLAVNHGCSNESDPFGTGAPGEYPRFQPVQFPSYKHETLPTHAYDHLFTNNSLVLKQSKTRKPLKQNTSVKPSPSKLNKSFEKEQRRQPQSSNSSPTTQDTDLSFKNKQNGVSPQRSITHRYGNRETNHISHETQQKNNNYTTLNNKEETLSDNDNNISSDEETLTCYPVPTGGILKPPNATTLQRLFQEQMVVVVEDVIQQPTKRQVKRRMNTLLSQLKGLIRIINLLLTCEPLRIQSIDYRLSIARPIPKDNNVSYESNTQVPYFVFENLTFPYLFLATLQNLFEMYPYSPSQLKWNLQDIADARRLTNLVLNKRLKGHEVLYFLSQIPQYIVHYIITIGSQFFKPPPDLAQFLMHFAFCIDSPELFYFSSKISQPFSIRDLFDWDKLIQVLLPHKKTFGKFLIPLITCRLKARLSQRFMSRDKDDDHPHQYKLENVSKDARVYVPFEERYLTTEFLTEFSRMFGSQDNSQLQNMLRWWKYEVARIDPASGPNTPIQEPEYMMTGIVQPPPAPLPRHLRMGQNDYHNMSSQHTNNKDNRSSDLTKIDPIDSRMHVVQKR